MHISYDEAIETVTVVGTVVSVLIFLWRVFRMTRSHMDSQEDIKKAIEQVKAEVSYNGGNSTKDMIRLLVESSKRIETRQKLIDQRSKAALHYQDQCLFEIDGFGNLTWANSYFYSHTVKYGDVSCGLDWITIVHEDEREDFLIEFNSCLKMARKLDVDTVSVDKRELHIKGYPYRVGAGVHEGFLVHIKIQEK